MGGAGFALKLIAGDRYRSLALVLYLATGWAGLIVTFPLIARLGLAGFLWMVLGGATYSSGVIFYSWGKLPFNHLVFQAFTFAGSLCFYLVILFQVMV